MNAVERLHNSIGYRPGVIARLELIIEESQIFFSFWAIVLARLSTLMVGTQQVVGNNEMQGIMTRIKLYAEKQLHIDSLTLSILFTMWYQLYDKVNHLAKTIGYFTFSSIGYTTQPQFPTAIDQPSITNPNHPKTHQYCEDSRPLITVSTTIMIVYTL
jgi:hypothetical protein